MTGHLPFNKKIRQEKIFAFFAKAHYRRIFFCRIILLSENFVTLKFLHVHVLDFSRGCQAVLTVPHGHQLFLTIRNVLCIDLHPIHVTDVA